MVHALGSRLLGTSLSVPRFASVPSWVGVLEKEREDERHLSEDHFFRLSRRPQEDPAVTNASAYEVFEGLRKHNFGGVILGQGITGNHALTLLDHLMTLKDLALKKDFGSRVIAYQNMSRWSRWLTPAPRLEKPRVYLEDIYAVAPKAKAEVIQTALEEFAYQGFVKLGKQFPENEHDYGARGSRIYFEPLRESVKRLLKS